MKCQCCPHIETSQLICTANQLTGFYTRATLAINGLVKVFFDHVTLSSRSYENVLHVHFITQLPQDIS